jgi:hypothetical protein
LEVGSHIFDCREIITSSRKRQWDWSFTTALTTIEITTCPTFIWVWVWAYIYMHHVCPHIPRSVVHSAHIIFCTQLYHNYLPAVTHFVFRINNVWLIRNYCQIKKTYRILTFDHCNRFIIILCTLKAYWKSWVLKNSFTSISMICLSRRIYTYYTTIVDVNTILSIHWFVYHKYILKKKIGQNT